MAQSTSSSSPASADQGVAAPADIVRPNPPTRVRVNQGVLKPTHTVKPIYPEAAVQLGITGTVTLRAIIGTDGRVNKLEPMSGDQVLVPAAIAAVEQWTYTDDGGRESGRNRNPNRRELQATLIG